MPPDTIYVGRPSRWGNPFTAEQAQEAGYRDGRGMAVYGFRQMMKGDPDFARHHPNQRQAILDSLPDLRGKNLCCWCPLDQPCHADVLLELANR
jgi:Domain of unknown function (DUF4326)